MRDLPPPLPPHERTMGQLVAETIRFYGNHFWRALPLGIPLALVDQFAVHRSIGEQMIVFWIASAGMPGALGKTLIRLPTPLPRTCISSKMPW